MNRIKVNFDEVICPNCVAQFRAIPVNIQQDLARLSSLADKWNAECDELREDNKRLSAERDALREAGKCALKAFEYIKRCNGMAVLDPIGLDENLTLLRAAMKGQP